LGVDHRAQALSLSADVGTPGLYKGQKMKLATGSLQRQAEVRVIGSLFVWLVRLFVDSSLGKSVL
jgi:hypothetical protein